MLQDIKSEPVWSSYLDPEDETTVLFYNRVTKKSVGEKPADYDGHYVIGDQSSRQKEDKAAKLIYERTFGDMSKMFCTPLETADVPIYIDQTASGVVEQTQLAIGGWEEVKEED